MTLTGANPSTNYELFFRPLDNSGDVDTGIAIPTNALGNAETGLKNLLQQGHDRLGHVRGEAPGDSLDQFVAGYEIH